VGVEDERMQVRVLQDRLQEIQPHQIVGLHDRDHAPPLDGASGSRRTLTIMPFALAWDPLNQQSRHLGVVVEGVALDGVEDRLGQVVEVEPGRVADVFHADLHGELAPGGARAAPGLAEELVDQRLVVLGLGGQAVDDHLHGPVAFTGAHLAVLGPGIVHAGGFHGAQSFSAFTAVP
jgi:hypothetical protein